MIDPGIVDTSFNGKRARMVTMPFPPTISQYYRSYRGRRLMSREGRQYRSLALGMAMLNKVEVLEGRLIVEINLYMPDNLRRDIDNYQKALLDSLTHARVWVDDSQVDQLLTIRRPVSKPGKAVVHVVEKS